MAPEKEIDRNGGDAIKALCYMIMTAKEFEPDTSQLAEYVGIADKKNVPRKINSLISVHGFEFKNQKIIEKDNDGGPQTPKTPTSSKKANATPKSKSEPKLKTPASKKRKVEEAAKEEEGGEDEDTVQQMILDAMGDGEDA